MSSDVDPDRLTPDACIAGTTLRWRCRDRAGLTPAQIDACISGTTAEWPGATPAATTTPRPPPRSARPESDGVCAPSAGGAGP